MVTYDILEHIGRMQNTSAGEKISTILKHDNKQTSYKIALLRSINDVVLSFPDVQPSDHDVAVPIRLLAEFWIAYYWPFADPTQPIFQGHRSRRATGMTNDMAFRPDLSALRASWEDMLGDAGRASDGFFVTNEQRIPRRRDNYPPDFCAIYEQAVRSIARTIEKQPVRYAGPGEWSVFSKPARYADLRGNLVALPGTQDGDICLVVGAALWQTFLDLSLWVEALCIHEWCLFTETVGQAEDQQAERGHVYELLTDRPDNRRPLTWERNYIDILIREGHPFVCPWTGRALTRAGAYELDHIIPLAVYPLNELWNLVPADPVANNRKRQRLPSLERMRVAHRRLIGTYNTYCLEPTLCAALDQESRLRFSQLETEGLVSADSIARSVTGFVEQLAHYRNLERY